MSDLAPPFDEPRPVFTLDAAPRGIVEQLQEVWRHRDLLYFLALRDLKIRYKQTVFGVAWAVVQPVTAMVLFSVFFGFLGRLPSDGLPYPLFAYAGLLPWSIMAQGLGESSASLVNNRSLVTKVYFPRLIVPMATLFVAVVDVAIASFVLALMMLAYGVAPAPTVVFLPVFIVLTAFTALGATAWLSALNVRYRDVRIVTPFLAQAWLLASPVAYPSRVVPEPWQTLYGLNPVAGLIEAFRWTIFGHAPLPVGLVVASGVSAVLLVAIGVWYFSRTAEQMADHL